MLKYSFILRYNKGDNNLNIEKHYQKMNLFTSFSALIASLSLTLSIFFPLTKTVDGSQPYSYIIYRMYTDDSFYLNMLSATGCFIAVFLIILCILGILNIVLQRHYNNKIGTKYLFYALLVFFYFPATFEWTSYGLNSLAGYITIVLTEAGRDVAIGKTSAYFDELKLTPWYFISLGSFVLLYLSFGVLFFLYFANNNSGKKPKQLSIFTYATNSEEWSTIMQRGIVGLGIVSTLLICISMLIKPYHWIGPDASQNPVGNFIIRVYTYDGDGTNIKSALYLMTTSLWFWLQIAVLCGYFIMHLIVSRRGESTYQFEKMITVKLLLVFLVPNAYMGIERSTPIFDFIFDLFICNGFIITLIMLDELIDTISQYKLHREAGTYDTTMKGHVTIWLFLISLITLVLITLLLVFLFLSKKKEDDGEGQ